MYFHNVFPYQNLISGIKVELTDMNYKYSFISYLNKCTYLCNDIYQPSLKISFINILTADVGENKKDFIIKKINNSLLLI